MLLAQWAGTGARADASWTNWDPLDARWYMNALGLESDAGIAVGPETIYRCGTVLAAVRFKADAVAVCTPQVGIRLENGDRKEDPKHYAQRVLRNPNAWQTGFEWTQLNVSRVSVWGNAYNRILPGRDSFVGELRPLHPARVRILDQLNDGSLVYEYKPLEGGIPQRLSADQVLHYSGISIDGIGGAPIYQLIRNAVGIALAAEKHAAVFLRRGTRLSGILSTKEPFPPEVQTRAENSWNSAFGGSENSGKVAMVGGGLTFSPISTDHKNAQYMELRDHQVEEILRALGVPGVVVGYQGDKASTYASAEAFFEKGGITHCILPLATGMEQRDEKALLLEGDPHYIKRNLGVLERANTAKAWENIRAAAGRPIITGNEGRRILDMNRDPDPSMDKVLLASNMSSQDPATDQGGGAPPQDAPPPPHRQQPPPQNAAPDGMALRAKQFAVDAASRVVRREIAVIKGTNGSRGKAIQYAKDPAGWKAWATEFYEQHAAFVAETLHIPELEAHTYAEGQRDALLAGGVAVTETWETDVVADLAQLAMGADVVTRAPGVVVNIRNIMRRPKVEAPKVEVPVTVQPAAQPPAPDRKPRSVKVEYGKDGRLAGLKEE